jgi:DNA-binding NtrC family response regulator
MTDYGENPALRTVFVNQRATVRHLRTARLRVTQGPDLGKEATLQKARLYAGRSRVNDLVLTDKAISGTHFELAAVEDGYLLRDLGSTNGVTYEGLRVKEIYLKPGCTFHAGNSSFTFQPNDATVEIPLSDRDRFGDLLGRSVQMREIFATLEKVSPSDLTVLIEGPTGTGKERVAHSIHKTSRRRKGPFIVLDCSAIPRDLMESTVFGHEKGAFTGAVAQARGAFEQANGGTIFMDEIGELPLDLQPKLLRVLETRELKRVGGDRTLRTDVRVLAATNRDLRKMVAEGSFREDLYFRLSVIQISLPPLHLRRDDIPALVHHFLDEFAARDPDHKPLRVAEDALRLLAEHPWPGNVRELKNVMERAASLCEADTITRADLHLSGSAPLFARPQEPLAAPAAAPAPPRLDSDGPLLPINLTATYKDAKQELLDQFEREYMARLIQQHHGNISQAARDAGLTRYHLRELLKKHDLT